MNEVELVKTTLRDVEPTLNRLLKDSEWTQEIMTRLCDAGQDHNYIVFVFQR